MESSATGLDDRRSRGNDTEGPLQGHPISEVSTTRQTSNANTEGDLDSRGEHILNAVRQENAQTAFQLACDKTNRLDQTFQALESKAGTLAGFLGAILAAILGFVVSNPASSKPVAAMVTLSLGICLIMVSLLFLAMCLTTRQWSYAPGWRQFDDTGEYGRDPARYRCQQIAGMSSSWTANSATLHVKALLFTHALWLMFAGILCFAVTTLLVVLVH
jgi:hypothetical protein